MAAKTPLDDIRDTLNGVAKQVDACLAENEKAAEAAAKKRDAAVKAAEAAGLSVESTPLEQGPQFAKQRFATLRALLIDAQTQLDQIEALTA